MWRRNSACVVTYEIAMNIYLYASEINNLKGTFCKMHISENMNKSYKLLGLISETI